MALDKRQLSVRMALEWAFMTECAQLDLNDGKAEHVKAIGTEYVLMQRMKLGGIRIDGGGRSFPHRDADLIAAGLTRLAMMPGRIRLAISVAEHARAGRVPDWMPGAVAKMEPAEWMPRRGFAMKPMGKSVVIRRYNRYVETPHPKNPKHKIRRRVKVEESWCPCVWSLHPQEIRTARADYTRWVVALEWLREYLRTSVDLDTIEITDHLPPHRPWAKPNPSGETPLETKSWR
ncbi:hypothetical protein [Sulfitobacter sp. EhC04]|uniref:hypothetical protein n=1 Tax=Sulfitobacter sp. EhC04 TaxID=1849168 RepID=UPI000833BF5E|nr:hypothetical protein [Sulfitobacter sp. EhC04]